jgi:hypothetical protein
MRRRGTFLDPPPPPRTVQALRWSFGRTLGHTGDGRMSNNRATTTRQFHWVLLRISCRVQAKLCRRSRRETSRPPLFRSPHEFGRSALPAPCGPFRRPRLALPVLLWKLGWALRDCRIASLNRTRPVSNGRRRKHQRSEWRSVTFDQDLVGRPIHARPARPRCRSPRVSLRVFPSV